MPAKFSEAEAAARRDQILAEAAKVFARKGYEGTTVKDLEEATGLTRGGLFFHFPGKRDLYCAAVERCVASGLPTVGRAVAGVESAEEALIAVFRAVRAWHREHPEAMALFNQIALHKEREADLAAFDEQINASMSEAIAGMIGELQRRGVFNPHVDTGALAELVHRLLDHVIEETLTLDDEAAETQARPLLQVIVQGVAPRPAREPA